MVLVDFKEILSTPNEWHYLTGGLTIGFLIGWILSRLFAMVGC